MKKLAFACALVAVLLSNFMSAAVAFNYCARCWGGRFAGYSAPPSAAFVLAIPCLIGIIACIVAAVAFWNWDED